MPTSARLLLGSFGFSTRRVTLPAASTSATPKDDGFGTSLSITDAASFGSARKRSTLSLILVPMRLSPRYMAEVGAVEEALRRRHGVREAGRPVLRDEGELRAERRAVAEGRLDLARRSPGR